MLSSISSFLPSALQIGNDKSPPSPTEQQRQLTASPTKDPDMTGDGSNVKKKKERTNESDFVERAAIHLSQSSDVSSPVHGGTSAGIPSTGHGIVSWLGHRIIRNGLGDPATLYPIRRM
ncbi:hypothetical protein ONZ51_g13074 [Trametes cubensis]|uniref:Uncharacterized protein n=1 Tax=Trametes cubensis TaxID=1111947 RepID=A0AAD7TG12_9APHY|nr:hypothetical protein ONZ51_g13074 [Trametes cubensis]